MGTYLAYRYEPAPWMEVLSGHALYSVSLMAPDGTDWVGRGDTLDQAWGQAVDRARHFGGMIVTDDCPWPEPVSLSADLVRGLRRVTRIAWPHTVGRIPWLP